MSVGVTRLPSALSLSAVTSTFGIRTEELSTVSKLSAEVKVSAGSSNTWLCVEEADLILGDLGDHSVGDFMAAELPDNVVTSSGIRPAMTLSSSLASVREINNKHVVSFQVLSLNIACGW